MRSSLLILLLSLPAMAKTVRKPVEYSLDDQKFEGVLVYDDAVKKPRPGLLMVPNWLGINEANLKQAELVAGKDYVLFVADLYGKGKQPKDREEGGKLSGALKADRPLMRARANAALAAMLSAGKAARIDEKKVGAIGFCFGGTAVIELAKSGADVKGVVSFHGGLDAPMPSTEKPKARVLALHGAEDPAVPPANVQAFMDDMRKVNADWTLVHFGGAVHSFTDPDANTPGRSMYDPKVAKRAYEMMRDFFAESF
jgi:dienelactone hydrolase